MEKPHKIKLHILSPVHIGCDDVYEPTNFVIDEARKKLIEFDSLSFISNLTQQQRNEFVNLCSSEKLLAIYKFVKRVYNNKNPLREVDVTPGLVDHYKKVLSMTSYDNKNIINQFTMNKTSYNPQTNEIYIPGTSVKGSLRTAFLSYLAAQKGIRGREERAKDLEIELLGGKFETDPFRLVKVSDFQPLETARTKVVYGINKKKKASNRETKAAGGPQQIFEVIERGSVFEGAININIPERTAGIKAAIEAASLFKALNYHYKKLFDQEMAVVKECGFNSVSAVAFEERLGKSCFLIRLGRHSGAEAITIENNRHIKIMQGRGRQDKKLPHSTTLWLASESARPTSGNRLTPFGWAILEVLPFDATKGLFSRSSERMTNVSVPDEQVPTQTQPVIEKPVQKAVLQQITWQRASLTYSPGNKTLIATYQNKKAELHIGDDRSIVPEVFHKTLFEKRKGVQLDIVVEPLGNAFKIIRLLEK